MRAFVPLDAAHTARGRALSSTSQLVVAKLPWDQRPTAETSKSKLGPPAADVDALYRTHSPIGA